MSAAEIIAQLDVRAEEPAGAAEDDDPEAYWEWELERREAKRWSESGIDFLPDERPHLGVPWTDSDE